MATSCKIISEKAFEEMRNQVDQLLEDLESERQTTHMLRNQIAKKESDMLGNKA